MEESGATEVSIGGGSGQAVQRLEQTVQACPAHLWDCFAYADPVGSQSLRFPISYILGTWPEQHKYLRSLAENSNSWVPF